MKTNRRNFIRIAGVTGTGIIAGKLTSCNNKEKSYAGEEETLGKAHKQLFNMSGYAAPKLEKVRIGFIGLGHRGPGSLKSLTFIEGVEIKALCDIHLDRVEKAQKILTDSGLPEAIAYGGTEDSWKKMCENPDIDLIYQVTPWRLHTPVSVYAMENDKHAAVEMPAALTIEECWQLVETSERTRKHCMQLENCCYGSFEMLILNMVRQGFFGEIIHADAAYIHSHMNYFAKGEKAFDRMWILKEFQHYNGNQYPSHGLGPVCQILDINRGDKLDYLTSMESNDFHFGKTVAELAKKDSFYKEFDTNSYRGNMNTSIIKTEKGKTIMLQYDISSPRPYSRIFGISGTEAFALGYPEPPKISQGMGGTWFNDEEMQEIWEKYTPEMLRRIGALAKEVGGHGGMDFLMNWHLIDCLRNGIPLDQDVYDAALWSVIVPLTQWSVANGSKPIQIPDFTCGSYRKNAPVDITLSQGGNTGVRKTNEMTKS
jgi:glycosyl hydrolase family 109/GFO/IDH/MocA oxidoreductase family protein